MRGEGLRRPDARAATFLDRWRQSTGAPSEEPRHWPEALLPRSSWASLDHRSYGYERGRFGGCRTVKAQCTYRM